MGSPNSHTLSKEQLQALYRSNVRQRTRAGLGTVISLGLTGSGLLYMAAPAVVAAHGIDKAEAARDQLSDIIKAHGYRARKRDKLAGALVGSAEKAVMSFLLLGHDEMLHLGEAYHLDPAVV
ncbi:hypothetical protein IQ07DRAFT_587027 [Pyrenochaeta sp. DS3sAY3a]|nr:hypothetical protein IQ07DRAFT_587027 [Pyrenochaeta sp. DS3sAY3a]